MKFEEININTENAISTMRAAVAHGILKRVSECWSFVSGYSENKPIMAYPVWEAIMELAKDGKIKYSRRAYKHGLLYSLGELGKGQFGDATPANGRK